MAAIVGFFAVAARDEPPLVTVVVAAAAADTDLAGAGAAAMSARVFSFGTGSFFSNCTGSFATGVGAVETTETGVGAVGATETGGVAAI